MTCPDCGWLRRRLEELEAQISDLEAGNAELRSRLTAYENPHTHTTLTPQIPHTLKRREERETVPGQTPRTSEKHEAPAEAERGEGTGVER